VVALHNALDYDLDDTSVIGLTGAGDLGGRHGVQLGAERPDVK